MKKTEIYLGAGCFWEVQKKLKNLAGVVETEVGYAGGHQAKVNYEQVCGGNTGHAEVVRVVYDADAVTTEKIIDFFLEIHDPTQVDRQGPDVGRQYRSVIFFQSSEEKTFFTDILHRLSKKIKGVVATQIEELINYNRAEEYHQNYLK